MMCPDCPSTSPYDLSNPRYMETATESLAKYNSRSPSKQYSVVKITKTFSQVSLKHQLQQRVSYSCHGYQGTLQLDPKSLFLISYLGNLDAHSIVSSF